MRFCEKCRNLMIVKKVKGRLKYTCRKCGHVSSRNKIVSTNIPERVREKEEKILIMTEEDTFKHYPKARIICPRCENNEAYWFMQQTRAADEPPTRFYCCTKCGYKWREY